jgi:hypothetical protein
MNVPTISNRYLLFDPAANNKPFFLDISDL